ncbi:saccharopine dehydrogenase NADP-binding domain-containing protein [Pseudomonas gingeri]|uniref:saccharopine dehydrogenase NADP-binding domain-containing protein n=1 Tax=Pseudomonas gingeri TaxID=117681 RepID=UPI0015A0AE9F|nr:saccharopine dehydrogenase NADP-binding domain-containing protein [Pseudomonas gingeri]NWD73147.1 saccharopine dehydrogenase NADP-binding domain-containing protein [Pseudomonas gingeri]
MPKANLSKILIAGGYGVIGTHVAQQLRQRHPHVELLIAGRNPARGEALAEQLGHASTVALDINSNHVPEEARDVDIIVCAMPDPRHLLAEYAIANGIAYINIAVANGDDVLPWLVASNPHNARRPIVPLGHYEAGSMLMLVAHLARSFDRVDQVEMCALNDPSDWLGEMTSHALAEEPIPALARYNGQWQHETTPREIKLSDGSSALATPFQTLDAFSVYGLTRAHTIRFDVANGASIGTREKARASMELYVEIEGVDQTGKALRMRAFASDPQGQAHFTAFGVVNAIDAICATSLGGVLFPEQILDCDLVLKAMGDAGIAIRELP